MPKPVSVSPEQAKAELSNLPGWSVVDGPAIQKQFKLPGYRDAVALATKIFLLAERMDHHPDVLVGWGKVVVTYSTHDTGGISDLDIAAAKQIEAF